jgi:hypothetical protein
MLRDLVQGFAVLTLLAAVVVTVLAPMAWPFLLCAAVLAASVFFERTLSRNKPVPRGPGWQPTAERFRDEESGAMVTVWFNAKTGERRYVEDGNANAG